MVRRGFEREIGNFESAERGTANDFINLLFPLFPNVNIFPLRATRTMVSPSGDGTLTNGDVLFSDNCNVYQSRVFCTRWDGLTKTDAINDAEYSDNRIEFYSPGGMFDGTRIQDRDILKVPSKRRNPIIADVFTQLDLMEKRGSGFQKITTHTSELRLYSKDGKHYPKDYS